MNEYLLAPPLLLLLVFQCFEGGLYHSVFFFGGLFCLAMITCTTLKLKFFRLNLDISIERNDFSRLNINPECFCFVPIIALSVFVILD